jgi:glycosyltransferase involved in cell wall biosynthesis
MVIPTHRALAELERTLAGCAALGSAEIAFEIIVIDNDSRDERLVPLLTRCGKSLDLQWYLRRDLASPYALCAARNIGLELARGDWVICLDADCIPGPDYLQAACAQAARGEQMMLAGERIFVDGRGAEPAAIRAAPRVLSKLPLVASHSNYGRVTDRRLPLVRNLPSIPHPWAYMHGGNLVFRRDRALEVGGFDVAYDGHWGYEDIDFAYRMIGRGGQVPRWAAAMAVYHQEPAGATSVAATDRYDKTANPNWRRICERIPGFRELKENQYRSLSQAIKLGPSVVG